MTKLQQKQLAFLEDTIAYYSVDPIGRRNISKYDDGDEFEGCWYEPKKSTSEGCAIGRHVSLELARELDIYGSVNNDICFNLLPKSLRELGQTFLSVVQRLHDTTSYWTETGLSDKGVVAAEVIRKQISSNFNIVN